MNSILAASVILIVTALITTMALEGVRALNNAAQSHLSTALIRLSALPVLFCLGGALIAGMHFSPIHISRDEASNAFLVWAVFTVFYLFKFYFPRLKNISQ